MRLEQRIGRVDRIGQTCDTVWIWSYFLEGTIEAEVYRRLVDRIDWFTGVVGPVQPILHQVGQAVKTLALMSRDMRTTRLDQELRTIEAAIDRAEQEGVDFDDHLTNPDTLTIPPPPITGVELENFMVRSNTIGHRFRPDADLPGGYRIDGQGVTFRHEIADQYPESLRLLTFGDPLFSELLRQFPDPAEARFGIARAEAIGLSPRQVGWYRETGRGLTTIDTMRDLQKALHSSIRNPNLGTEATSAFLSYLENQQAREKEAVRARQAERRSALLEDGHRILRQATYVSLARQDTLFETASIPMTKQAIISMVRTERFPFAPLATLTGIEIHLSAADSEWQAICGKSRSSLDGMMQNLRNQATKLLDPLAATTSQGPHLTTQTDAKAILL